MNKRLWGRVRLTGIMAFFCLILAAVAPRPARPAVPARPVQQAENGPLAGRVLLVDAGHGGTDAGAIIGTRGGVPTACLAIPIRYTHCPNEIGDLEVAENCARLLAEAVCR